MKTTKEKQFFLYKGILVRLSAYNDKINSLRHLLLGRKALTNLDSILKKQRPLPTMVHIVKAIVFPVVMYGCESWSVKKAEH